MSPTRTKTSITGLLLPLLLLQLLAPLGEATASFLRVADDMDTTAAGARMSGLAVTDCGFKCFNAGPSQCRGFVWRPFVDSSFYDQYNSSRNSTPADDSAQSTFSPLVGSFSLGRCGLMKCVPPPSSLTPAPGSQIYLMSGTSAVAYGSIMVPPSYRMACTFAYRIYDKVQLSFEEAERQCLRDRARLIAIKTAEQQRIMTGQTSRSEAYWIGLDDRDSEGNFVMSDGTKPKYLNWDSGQPNNYIKDEKDQDCTMLYQGTWNDNQCDQMLRFICEIPFLEL